MKYNFLILVDTISLDFKTIIILGLISFIFGMLTMSQNTWREPTIRTQGFGLGFNALFLGAILLLFTYLMTQQPSVGQEVPQQKSNDDYVSIPIQSQRMDLSQVVNHSMNETAVETVKAIAVTKGELHERGSPNVNRGGQDYVIQVAAVMKQSSIATFMKLYSNHPLEVVDDNDGKTKIWIIGFGSYTDAETYKQTHQIEGFIKPI